MKNRLSLSDARAAFPKLGFAIYAYDPTGPMTLEVIAVDGQTFTFEGPDETALIARAFPLLAVPEAAPEPAPAPPVTTTNVFD